MIFIQLFVLCISVVAYATDEQINMQQNESSTETLIEDNPYDLVKSLIWENIDPENIYSFTVINKFLPVDDIKKKFIAQFERNNNKFKNFNIQNMILHVDNLTEQSYKDALSSLYADSLKKKMPTIQQDLSCDNLPINLEPLIAGWLLHDLFKNQEPHIKDKLYKFGNILNGPFISNSDSNNNFVCVWKTHTDDQILFFDSLKKNPLKKPLDQKTSMREETQCVISTDGTYMAVLVDKKFSGNFNWKATILIYNLREFKKETPNHIELINTIELNDKIENINAIKFQDDNKLIIIRKQLNQQTVSSYNVKTLEKIESVKGVNYFLTINKGAPASDLITYNTNHIQEFFIPNFESLLKMKLKSKLAEGLSYQKAKFDPQHLHINFIEKKLPTDTTRIGTYYPCDPNLIKAINFLNKEVVNNNNKRVLATTCLLYHMYTNPTDWVTSWKESTNKITDDTLLYKGPNALIPEEIQRIYNLQEKINQQEKLIANQINQQKIRSLSLWESWQQGKLKQRMALLFSDYKKPLQYGLGTLGVATIGAAWWWSKKGALGSQMPIKLQNPKSSTPVSNPKLNVNRP